MNFGLKFSEQEAIELLKEFRVDEDGNVDWKEFCRAMK
jgi:Ca2+-binding EF-hand superfamily protein